MKLGAIHHDMTVYQVADALRMAPDAHPDVWRSRLIALRNQGREMEAAWIERTFPEYMSDAAAEAQNCFTDQLITWAEKLGGTE